MRWWQRGDCRFDGLWVLVDLGGCGMGCGLVFRWPNRCWYGVWVTRLVVVWCLSGCGLVFRWSNQWWFDVWVVVVIGDWCLGARVFFFFFIIAGCCLARVCSSRVVVVATSLLER